MAMTATIALSPSTVLINQQFNAVVTVSNSGSSAITMISMKPTSIITGGNVATAGTSSGLGVIDLGPGVTVAVPASGSLKFAFSGVFFSPSTGPLGTVVNTYDVGCQCYSSDGSNFVPSAATITVNPISLPAAQQ